MHGLATIVQRTLGIWKASYLFRLNLFDEFYFKFSHLKDSHGEFYCEKCKTMLCKICFLSEHKHHNSGLIDDYL